MRASGRRAVGSSAAFFFPPIRGPPGRRGRFPPKCWAAAHYRQPWMATEKGWAPYGQSSYDQNVTVVPGKPENVYLGGVGPYVSTDAGGDLDFHRRIGQQHHGAGNSHRPAVLPLSTPFNPNKLYLGNDGGFYVYDLAKGNWTAFFNNNQNATISSGQIQGIGPHPTDNTKLLAGFQDNGTQLYTGTLGWNTVETGDGGFALFDALDPNFAYHTFATSGGPQPSRSTDGGLTWDSTDALNGLGAVIGSDTFRFLSALGGRSRQWQPGHDRRSFDLCLDRRDDHLADPERQSDR